MITASVQLRLPHIELIISPLDREIAMSIEQRLQRLETENRRLKRAGLVLLLFPALFVLMGQATPDKAQDENVLRASRFVLTDADGHERGVFGLRTDGQPYLKFLDPNGKTRIQLYVAEKSSALHFFDADGVPRIELARAEGGPILNFIGEDSASRVALSAGEETKLELWNSDNGHHRPILSMKEGEHIFYDVGGTKKLLELLP